MLQNAYFLAKIGADTAETEQHLAEILPKLDHYALASRRGTGSCVMAWICARSASKLDMTARAALADAQLSPPPPDP